MGLVSNSNNIAYDSLNPYSNGRYSMGDVEDTHIEMKSSVLILILMEYAL